MADEPKVDESNAYYKYGYQAGLAAGKRIGRQEAEAYAARTYLKAEQVKKEQSIAGRAMAISDWCKRTLRTVRSLRLVAEEED
jgi:hypothetical protein